MDTDRDIVETDRTCRDGLPVEGIVEEDRSTRGGGTDHEGAKLLTKGHRYGMTPVHVHERVEWSCSQGGAVHNHILDPVSLVGSHYEDLVTSTGDTHISPG